MSRKAAKTIAIIIVVAMVVTSLSMIFSIPGVFGAEYVYAGTTSSEQKYLDQKNKELEDFLKMIHDNYKDKIDYETLMDGAFSGVTYSLGDPYSVYYVETEDGLAFQSSASGDYEGIGVGLHMNMDAECEISSVNAGGAAVKAGVRIGDIVVKIDGQDVTKKSLSEISNLLRGTAGTKVKLTVLRDGKEQTFDLTRTKVTEESVAYKLLDDKIGYISISGFYSNSDTEFRKAKIALINQGAESLIVDIRNNPGGLVESAINIADEYMPSGVISIFEQQEKVVETINAVDRNEQKIPIVLLVNENSASASEILAAAWQDNKVATVVGTTTYGKGVAQVMGTLKDGSMFKLSAFYFMTPNRKMIHDVGITPDYTVRNTIGEDRQEALDQYLTFAPFAEETKPKSGDIGLNVYAAQQRLELLGYKVKVTGTMDGDTVLAVQAFQKEAGLYAYGILDFTTMVQLEQTAQMYVTGTSPEDLQLNKAIELLTK